MADDKKVTPEEGEETVAKKGGSKLIVILLVLVIFLGAGGAAAFLFLGGSKDKGAAKAKGADDDVAEVGGGGAAMGPTLSLKSFIINLDEPGAARYLKLTVDLEFRKALTEVQAKQTVRVRDKIIVFLSGLHMVDVQKRDAKLKLKKSLVKLANEAYGARRVRHAYFKEFVIQ